MRSHNWLSFCSARVPTVALCFLLSMTSVRGRPGHCGATERSSPGICLNERGSWELSKMQSASWNAAKAACLEMCSSCVGARCKVVSVSLQHRDCSWFSSCDRFTMFSDFRTFNLPSKPLVGSQHSHKNVSTSAELQEARAQLGRLLAHEDHSPWFTPHARMAVAVAMFGKVGTFSTPASGTSASSDGYSSSSGLVRLAHATVRRHVLVPNPRHTMSIFLHSWNPKLGSLLDRLYAPVWSMHERVEERDTLASVSLSIRRVLLAIERHEQLQRGGQPFDLVACWRHDLFFGAPLRWGSLPRAQLWFLAHCCMVDARGITDFAFAEAAHKTLEAQCGRDGNAFAGSFFSDLCRAGAYLSLVGKGKHMKDEAQYNYWVNDWLFVAPSRTAHSFGLLHANLAAYERENELVGINLRWQHFYWAAHVHHVLRAAAGVRSLPLRADFEVWLGRHGRQCRTNVSVWLPRHPEPIWGGMQQALCPKHEYGRIVCPRDSPRCNAEQRYPAAQFDLDSSSD